MCYHIPQSSWHEIPFLWFRSFVGSFSRSLASLSLSISIECEGAGRWNDLPKFFRMLISTYLLCIECARGPVKYPLGPPLSSEGQWSSCTRNEDAGHSMAFGFCNALNRRVALFHLSVTFVRSCTESHAPGWMSSDSLTSCQPWWTRPINSSLDAG